MQIGYKRLAQGCFGLLLIAITSVLYAAQLPKLPQPDAASLENDPNVSIPFVGFNQPTMTLRDAVLLALRMNPDVRNAELQRVVDKFSLAVSHNEFEPQYTLEGTANFQAGSTPTYSVQPGISLTTPYGTKITTGVNDTLNGSAVGTVTVTQPLLQGFGRDVTQAGWYNAVIGEENAKLNMKSSIMGIIVDVVQAYYTWVEDYRRLAVDQQSLKDQKTQLYQTQMRVKAGKVAPADAVQQEASVASARLSVASDQNTMAQDYQALLSLLGLDPNAKISLVKTIPNDSAPLPTLQKSIDLALAYNTQYQTTLNGYKMDERTLITAKDAQKWTVNAVGTLSRDLGSAGDAGTGGSVPFSGAGAGGTGTAKSLAINVTVPINNLAAKQQLVDAKIKLEQDKINFEKARRALITSVINAYTSLQSQRQQIQMSENNVKLQEKSLQIEQIKYAAGRSTPLNLQQQRTALTSAQLNLITQRISYINNIEQFYQTLGITLGKWKITLIY